MTCDATQELLSAAFDGEAGDDAAALGTARAHQATCPDCGRFTRHLDATRVHLLAEVPRPAGAPDLATAVLARVRVEPESETAAEAVPGAERRPTAPVVALRPVARRRPWRVPAAAVFVAAALAGAVLVHTATDPGGGGVAAADLPARVVAAQHDVTALTAHLTVVERGWNPAVPERRFTGALRYAAPESLELHLVDRTPYPAAGWRPSDLHLVVDEDRWSVAGVRDCPSAAQPACAPDEPDRRSQTGRAPFSTATPAPLELIMPVQSFALAGTAVSLPPATVDGRPTVGIETTAAQVGPLLDALRPTGNLRQVHPADPVRLRLDEATLVPLRVTVQAGTDPGRAAWAQERGYDDRPGLTVLDLTVRDLAFPGGAAADAVRDRVHDAVDGDRTTTTTADGGFRDEDLPATAVPEPRALPAGLRPHRVGTTATPDGPTVHTRTWSDGRAWLAVSATDEWPGGRLFGELGGGVRPLALGAAGTGYLSEDGARIGLHADGRDLVVAGSVDRDELVAAAASLGVVGHPVPGDWDERATADLTTARAAVGRLLLPVDLDGFAPPALRVDGGTVTASFTGAGDRRFVVEQSGATKLPPPVDADGVTPVEVRGRAGRFAVDRGELEWFERGHVLRLRSLTLGRAELVAIADRLVPR